MCPNTQSMYFMFVLITVLYAVIIYRWILKRVRVNFETLGRILQGPEKQKVIFGSGLSGYYQGRRVALVYSYIDKGRNEEFYIEPKYISNPQKAFVLFDYPRPTPNTQWRGKKIYFYPYKGILRVTKNYYKIHSEAEFKQMLDELSEAAHMVESGISRP